MAPSQKINLKDKVEDGEIDLSMCDLQEVPVREIAGIRNIYSLDLSNNHLATLPKNFASLTHLTKLDLSKNVLKELPENFGDLTKLKHLDLYKNELKHLPLSFNKLKALKWLDLKDNPLVPAIKDMAGPCLDAKQCQVCAKNIVQFFTDFQQKVEIERDVREKQRQKDKQANELAQQKLKQQEKKSRKKEKARPKANGDSLHDDEIPTIDQVSRDASEEKIKEPKRRDRTSPSIFIMKLFLLSIITVLAGLFISTSINLEATEFIEVKVQEIWKDWLGKAPPNVQLLGNNFAQYFKSLHTMTGEGLFSMASYFRETKQQHG